MDLLEQLTRQELPAIPDAAKFGIGIIGSGFIVKECHLPAYRQAGYRVVGIAARSEASARAVAEQFKLPKAYASVQALLDDPEVTVVDIAVPPQAQPDLIRLAADCGKHILAQKPLATNLQEAMELVAYCERAGVKLVVNQNGRFDPAVAAAKQLLEAGYVGKPVMATIELRFKPHWQPYQLDSERLMFLFMSIHHLDQFRYWFGAPKLLYASAAPHPEGTYKGEYLGSYNLEYESGLLATAWDDGFTWDKESFGVFYKIEGTEGAVKMNIGWPSGGPSALSFYSRKYAEAWVTPDLKGSWFPGAFQYTMGELLHAIATDSESSISGRNNLVTMAMMEACYLSSSQKKAIAIHDLIPSNPI